MMDIHPSVSPLSYPTAFLSDLASSNAQPSSTHQNPSEAATDAPASAAASCSGSSFSSIVLPQCRKAPPLFTPWRSESPHAAREQDRACWQCRLIGTSLFWGISGYTALLFALARKGSGDRRLYLAASTAFFVLGTYRAVK
ncbi:unnamed protein product [Vitrella brassicaformis CCMP3155]|uniref:DUF4536 domain-containing protein n=1 Tax=Vitrella brassicaformis (strain CCMP3155) TaxID=1169540 RepID=A0A0G4H358_VITBC|nr:unnamed protein product [Vitrella brassicaformis CCMP3155]|eukprot:CEM38136.1 unnamed protein product [Vitrella brassicaformis CCMP3155]